MIDDARVQWVDLFLQWIDTPYPSEEATRLRQQMEAIMAEHGIRARDIPKAMFTERSIAYVQNKLA
jgi:hypothetical protein